MEISLNWLLLLLGTCFVPITNCVLTKEYSSYIRFPLCSPSENIRYPDSAKAVVAIVQEAIKKGLKVKAFGARHSLTDIICTEGIPIDNRKLKQLKMHSDKVTATFGAGVTVREATDYLRGHGRALKTIPGFGNITISGAVGTGAHGSTLRYNESLSGQVVSMTIVNGLGKLVVISLESDLRAARIHLGLLGIVVDVTFNTVPLYKVRAQSRVVSDEALTNGDAINWAKNADQMYIAWHPSLKEVVVFNLTFVDVKTPGDASTHLLSSYDQTNIQLVGLKELSYNLTFSGCGPASSTGYDALHAIESLEQLGWTSNTPGTVPIYTEDGTNLTNPAVGYYNLMLSEVCSDVSQGPQGMACLTAHTPYNLYAMDNEFGIALSDLPAVVKDVKDILSKTPATFFLGGIFFRFSRHSNTYMQRWEITAISAYMSTSYGRDTAHFEFLTVSRMDRYNLAPASLAAYQTIAQTLMKKYKARPHWGKSGLVYHNSENLNLKLDKNARQKFIDAMNKYDPHEVFINNFGRRLKRKGTKIDTDPLVKHCAIEDNCYCSTNTDCGPSQTCTSLPGYSYLVCKTKNEVGRRYFNQSAYPKAADLLAFLTEIPNDAAAQLKQCSKN